jgi:uncharacterized protein (DUF4415 family)
MEIAMAIQFGPAKPTPAPSPVKRIIASTGPKTVAMSVADPTDWREPPDTGFVTISPKKGRPSTGKAKKAVTVRLDADVVERLEKIEDWRSIVNTVLRTHLKL